jgi:hypothetical protein
MSQMSVTTQELTPEWLSFHLYYHEDLGRAVRGFVSPVVSTLLHRGWIDRFFFLRYSLGGPHVRLRLRTPRENQAAVSEATRRGADLLLRRTPSTRSLEEGFIRSQNISILESDAHETDASVYYPDNTFLSVPFRPELERYGGADLLAFSLDAFTASSIEALRFLSAYHAEPVSRRLVLALRVLLRQALYFAADEEELSSLVGYAVASWGDSFQGILEKGERVFTQQRESFGKVLEAEIVALAGCGQTDELTLAAAVRRLSLALAGKERSIRWRIGGSHLHMTANRLGLSNPEEVYIGRLLTASAEYFLTPGSGLHHDLREALADKGFPPPDDLPLPLVEFGDSLP